MYSTASNDFMLGGPLKLSFSVIVSEGGAGLGGPNPDA